MKKVVASLVVGVALWETIIKGLAATRLRLAAMTLALPLLLITGLFPLDIDAETQLDYMEYATDVAAQAAYVSNELIYGSDILTGGTATMDDYNPGGPAAAGCDDNEISYCIGSGGSGGGTPMPHWWKYDLGAGVSKTVRKLRIKGSDITGSGDAIGIKDFTFQGSNNDSSWTTIHTGQQTQNQLWQDYTFANPTSYRYYRVYVTTNWAGGYTYLKVFEFEMLEIPLRCYSESTIKQQGSYSLQVVAKAPYSLNDTLTRNVSPTIDLSNKNTIKCHIRASRTGTNIQLQIHDSGGTTTSKAINVATADTWQEVNWDIFSLSNADKDAIDKIVIKISNADVDNTFYLDNMYETNLPPSAFSLTAPSHLASTNDNTPAFSWGTSSDPESQPITYTLKLSTTAGFTEPVYRTVSCQNNTSYTPDAGEPIANGIYYWKVIASDGVTTRESTQTWQLTVDTQVPITPIFTVIFSDPQTGKIIGMKGTVETGTTLTFYDKDKNAIPGTTNRDGNNFTFTPTMPLDPGSSVYVESQDGASNTSQSKTKVIVFEAYDDIFKDIAVSHGTGSGTSLRMEKNTSYEFALAVNAVSPVTVHAWMKYNSEYDGSGANPPQITLSGMGITTGNTAVMTAPASYTPDTWEELTVSGTPNAKGVVTLKVETCSTADGSRSWIDDLSVAQ